MSPKSLRAFYTGQIRPIALYGAEAWFRTMTTPLPKVLQDLEYKALATITGGFKGSSMTKLLQIANIEPMSESSGTCTRRASGD